MTGLEFEDCLVSRFHRMIDFIISLITGLLFTVCALGSSAGKANKQQFAKRFIVTTTLTTLFCFLAFRLVVPNINLADNIINTILILERGNFSPPVLKRLILEIFPLALISAILILGGYLSRHRDQLEGKSFRQIAVMPLNSIKRRGQQLLAGLSALEHRLTGKNRFLRFRHPTPQQPFPSSTKRERPTLSSSRRRTPPTSVIPPEQREYKRPSTTSRPSTSSENNSSPTTEQVLTALKTREAALQRKAEARRRMKAEERRRLQEEFEAREKARIAEEEERRLEKQRESERRRREEEREAKRRQAERQHLEQARRREEELRRERAEKAAKKAAEQAAREASRAKRKARAQTNTKSKKPDMTPYFTVLGVSPSATAEEVKRAYREKIRSYHPDQVQNLGPELRELAEQKTREINEAYTMIKRSQTS